LCPTFSWLNRSLIIFLQRHKLGPNLTPVTPETFAKWKKTRMDKKEAELEAARKAKEAQNSAGKNTGMSGRDLVRQRLSFPFSWTALTCCMYSSNIIQSGSKRRTMVMHLMIGISLSIEGRRSKKIWRLRRRGLRIWLYETD
jgi:DRG Family Regulatory Proteins, Tma46